MEISRNISETSIPSNTGNKIETSNSPANNLSKLNFNSNNDDPNAAFPLDVHVTSNIGDLRVFPDDRNLYEIVLNKEAAPKRKEMNWQALAGGFIGTAIPALLFYSAKLKKGQVNVKVIEGLNELINPGKAGSVVKELNYANAKASISKVAKDATTKAVPEVQEGLNKLFEKLDKIEDPKKALSKLLEEARLVHELKKLNKPGFYFDKGKELYFQNAFENAIKLFKKVDKDGNVEGKNSFLGYLSKADELSLKEVLLIGVGSITGGYLGGVAKDDGEINKKKTKEATYQLINNIICPTILTEQLISRAGLDIKPPKGAFAGKRLSQIGHYAKCAGSIILGVGVGINVGTRIANFVNKQYFKDEKYERKIGKFDVFIHVDDVPLALNFMQIPFMDKLLLFCSGLCGYEAGKKE